MWASDAVSPGAHRSLTWLNNLSVEHRYECFSVVVLDVVGSSPITHPKRCLEGPGPVTGRGLSHIARKSVIASKLYGGARAARFPSRGSADVCARGSH
jgi:hypothetical protein